MEIASKTRTKGIILVVIVVLLGMTSISSAYSYSSSVSINDNSIGAHYLTIDVFNTPYDSDNPSSGTQGSMVFNISVDADRGKVPETSQTFAYDGDGGFGNYYIRISSDYLENAYLYGYFSCGTLAGIIVKDIKMTLADSNMKQYNCVLTRDAFKSTVDEGIPETSLNQTAEGMKFCDLLITSLTVEYYPGLIFSQGHIPVSVDGQHVTDVSESDALSISDFNFHFLTSAGSLLGSA